jgi:hypothetical protein
MREKACVIGQGPPGNGPGDEANAAASCKKASITMNLLSTITATVAISALGLAAVPQAKAASCSSGAKVSADVWKEYGSNTSSIVARGGGRQAVERDARAGGARGQAGRGYGGAGIEAGFQVVEGVARLPAKDDPVTLQRPAFYLRGFWMWIASPTACFAASITASPRVGCGWIVRPMSGA